MENLGDRALHGAGWLATVAGALLRISAKVGAVLCVIALFCQWVFADTFNFLNIAPIAVLSLCGAAFFIGTAIKTFGLTLVGKDE